MNTKSMTKTPRFPLWDRAVAVAKEDSGIFAFLAALLVSRIVSADRRSYWLDELISVYESGSATSSFRESMGKVVSERVHPPLYEAILYFWMQIFGHSENSTRGLSSVFMALAALAMYYLVKTQWSRLPAFLGAAGMSVTAGISEYALESRNYAQLTFFTVLSALFAIHFLRSASTSTNSPRVTLWWLVFLGGANTALLLTHYYSVFWLAAQAIFILSVVSAFVANKWGQLLRTLLVAYIFPVLLFAALWGWVLIRAIDRQASRFRADDGPSQTPWEVLVAGILAPNIAGGLIAWIFIGGVIAITFGISLLLSVRAGKRFPSKPLLVVFLGHWLFTPLVFVWLGYLVLGSEIYHPRYFIYALPPLIPLLVIAVWEAAHKILRTKSTASVSSTVTVAVFLSVLVLPPASEALARDTGDYRGIAQEVVEVINSDPDNSYAVFSTNRGEFSLVNYYFERFDERIRSQGSFRLAEDPSNDFDVLRKQADVFAENDFVVIVFTFDGSAMYPNLIEQLDTRFTRVNSQQTSDTRGFIVWKT